MTSELLEIQNNSGSTEFLRSLNLLDLHESAREQRKLHPTSSSVSVRPGAGNLPPRSTEQNSDVLDFSVPTFSGELCRVEDADAAVARPVNRYEAEITQQVAELDSESAFTAFTKNALVRDADKYPPTRNEALGTTTYTIEQYGMSDRDLLPGRNEAAHYKRLVTITVPDAADSLDDCRFEYQDRQQIEEKEFNDLVSRAKMRQVETSFAEAGDAKLSRPEDISFYTHGIRTAAVSSDFQALTLQLTQGLSVINVDWKSTPRSEEKVGLCEAYNAERKGAAESYGRFEKALDAAIGHIGAEHTNMIAFSHGSMFDTRYLHHRKASGAPRLNQVIFSHADVPIATMPQPDADGKVDPANQLYSQTARNTFVIGSVADLAMSGAAYNDCEPSKSDKWVEQLKDKQREMAKHARIGDGGRVSRRLVEASGGTYVAEIIPPDKKDPTCHFVNMNVVSTLVHRGKLEKVAQRVSAGN